MTTFYSQFEMKLFRILLQLILYFIKHGLMLIVDIFQFITKKKLSVHLQNVVIEELFLLK